MKLRHLLLAAWLSLLPAALRAQTTDFATNTLANVPFESGDTYSVPPVAYDALGNGLIGLPFDSGESYILPATEPGAPVIVTAQGTTNGTYGLAGVLTFTVGFNVPVTVTGVPQLPLVFESGTRAASYVAGSGGPSLVFQYTPQAPDTDTNGLAFTFPLLLNGGTIQAAGVNAALGFIAVNAQPGVFVDTTPPTVVIGAPSSNSTSFGPVSYAVTYSDANPLTVTLTNAHLTLHKTGDADAQVLVSGTGTNRTVTLTNITGFNGTLGISLAAATAVDTAGNPAPAAGPSATFTVQRPPNAAPSFGFGFNIVSTLAGTNTSGSADGTGSAALFNQLRDVAVDSAGNVYVGDLANHRIRKITPAGVVTTLAGSTLGSADGTGTAAQFSNPQGVAVDGAGNVYVADGNHRIRKITPAGVVTTLAGSTEGLVNATGTAAKFNAPNGVAVDSAGNVYVTDAGNHRIRKVTAAGVVTTLAGSTNGFADGSGTAAKFNFPRGAGGGQRRQRVCGGRQQHSHPQGHGGGGGDDAGWQRHPRLCRRYRRGRELQRSQRRGSGQRGQRVCGGQEQQPHSESDAFGCGYELGGQHPRLCRWHQRGGSIQRSPGSGGGCGGQFVCGGHG